MELDLVDISRWQFGITTVYHYIFVPLTMGLAPMVAIMQTIWHRTGNPEWFRATKFLEIYSWSILPWVWLPASYRSSSSV